MLETCNEYITHHVSALPTGVYTVQNNGKTSKVYCVMDIDSGGWTLVSEIWEILAFPKLSPKFFLLR